MADLSTSYMGIPLGNPVVVSACSLSGSMDNLKQIEQFGAGGLVIKSLFEEQILHEMGDLDEMLSVGSDAFAESLSYFPKLQHGEAREHLMWMEEARRAVRTPLFGSLNAVTPGKWVEYARQMSETGVDGIELNVYAVESDLTRDAAAVERRLMETFEAVSAAVTLPIAVKLAPYYTSVGNVVQQLDRRGARAAVLFNRFLQPDIDPETEALLSKMNWSRAEDMRLPLRWIALLYGKVNLDLAGSTGVSDAADVARYILAGAAVVQVAGALYRNGLSHLAALVSGLASWMDRKGHARLADVRGRVSQREFKGNAFAFERFQYHSILASVQR